VTPFVLAPAVPLAGAAAGTRVQLDRDATHHLERVLRVRPGAAIEVTDGCGAVAPAVVRADGVVELTAGASVEPAPRPRIEVFQALPRGRKLDEVLRTCTELGADRLAPVTAARSVVELGEREAKRLARWRAVVASAVGPESGWDDAEVDAASAVGQSRRPWAPDVDAPVPATEAFAAAGADAPDVVAVLAHVDAPTSLRDVLEPREGEGGRVGPPPARVLVAVGPESGWDDAEVDAARAAGWQPARLSAPVLRTEHAAPALVAVVAYALRR
jgi:16S rRNA (uracil1498-N3)-methyltransferase